ncbi:hypothetical protein TGPRC2_217550 [Toxoplasma gondii TgCatPRC2]|uniref:Dynactin subunit 6 n=13 Tax=Toxoplasma gondii TaxID=5811 RepID=A0A125YQ24_TOXGV|nr:hypothetical protein TGME49_217550 [Toxoplasma gondii ME49]EPT24733.1 hypothetical protein TGME49_217550 [Toxoplasma gondii ME49]ESS34107.1 hypothetical protein TGVEG_217550 [Toxoplasma gondii VEG]KYF48910.1 hypothetical protein TGARI_217550 [Toxoplasma gondii ARI]KYK67040.1 hypothetical protein TGPRC2_217550 [Toxoplasma gondii TgCatPRC2]|eukprot:XP_018634855.1 hypothetical protein TGME49_217550 [Toxoplasma gondii ME49]
MSLFHNYSVSHRGSRSRETAGICCGSEVTSTWLICRLTLMQKMASSSQASALSSDKQQDVSGQAAGTESPSGQDKTVQGALVHPRAVLKGNVELNDGCCIGVATVIDGGQGGISFGKNTVVEDRVQITNSNPTRMTIGSYTWIEDHAVLRNVQKVGDYVRIEAAAQVVDCEELGNGCTVTQGVQVKSRGAIGPQTVIFGEVGRMAHDPSSMMRHAASVAAYLPGHQRLLENHV